jgi:uncharacterized membrane protein
LDLYREALHLLRLLALTVGTTAIFLGILRAALVARGPEDRGRVASSILGHASLGLEFFVGATLLNLVLKPTLAAAATTATTIVIRKLLTFSLGLQARNA